MKPGLVYIVGAGPGDPGLITVKGLGCVESADVVLFDRLVDKRLLTHAGPEAEVIDVGKVPGEAAGRQAKINALLVGKAREGKRVVRLKGGDPFVFGRGGEEAEALHAEGIRFEVVPGVTSAIAAAAYGGIPVTHRGIASSVTIVTGSEEPDKPESGVDWGRLAEQQGTLVVLMGWENLANIMETLTRFGRAPDTPVALVQWGTEPYQRTVVGTLSNIVSVAEAAGLSPPVVIVIGGVVDLREKLRWFDNRPLFGKRVLVTRTRTQASELSDMLSQRGAQPIELPTIEVQALDDYGRLDAALSDLGAYDWVFFTSVNAVGVVFDRIEALGLDVRAFRDTRVGAIGQATAASLRKHGIVADFVPDPFVSKAMVDGLKQRGLRGERVLLPRADIAPDALSDGLTGLGAVVDEITAYRTVAPKNSVQLASSILAKGIDVATFTSSSTVRNLVEMLDGNLNGLSKATVACIGPVTAATAEQMGFRVGLVAGEHTISGLVDSLEEYFTKDGPSNE